MMRKMVLAAVLAVLAVTAVFTMLQLTERKTRPAVTVSFKGFLPPVEGVPVSEAQATPGQTTIMFASTARSTGQAGETGIVTVAGRSSVSLEASLTVVRIAGSAQAANASEAVGLLAEKMDRIVSSLEQLGVGKDEVRTVRYSVTPVYDEKRRTIVGYRAYHEISVSFSDKKVAARAIDAASVAGADNISVYFTVTREEFDAAYIEALEAATRDAVRKASAIAKALNASLGEVVEAVEAGYFTYPQFREGAMLAYAEGKGTELYETTATVTASVTLKIRLVQGQG